MHVCWTPTMQFRSEIPTNTKKMWDTLNYAILMLTYIKTPRFLAFKTTHKTQTNARSPLSTLAKSGGQGGLSTLGSHYHRENLVRWTTPKQRSEKSRNLCVILMHLIESKLITVLGLHCKFAMRLCNWWMLAVNAMSWVDQLRVKCQSWL